MSDTPEDPASISEAPSAWRHRALTAEMNLRAQQARAVGYSETIERLTEELAEVREELSLVNGTLDNRDGMVSNYMARAEAAEAARDEARTLLQTAGLEFERVRELAFYNDLSDTQDKLLYCMQQANAIAEDIAEAAKNWSSPPQPSGPVARALSEWHEDVGDALWWAFPVIEEPYCGSPICTNWPGYHTHWTVIEVPSSPPKEPTDG